MALDGTTLAAVIHELSVLEGGRIDKIAQPEPDEILINIRAKGANHRLILTANSNAPRLGFTLLSKAAPLQAPMFCMVLRKHLSGGRVLSITQPHFERIAEIHVEALDEMGDKSEKVLLIEIMGRHSNIILLYAAGKIVDAIKHVPLSVSAARQVLPGMAYSPPPSPGRANPLETAKNAEKFFCAISTGSSQLPVALQPAVEKCLYMSHNGISPILATEICTQAGLTPEKLPATMTDEEKSRLYAAFAEIFSQVEAKNFSCAIYKNENGKTVDIAALPLSVYEHLAAEKFDSPSAMLEEFYAKRDERYRLSQKTADMRKIISAHLERCHKKNIVHEKTLAETQNRDELRIKGELLTAYLYLVPSGAESFTAENFYADNAPMEIALDPALSPAENAQAYFKKYNKQKRAYAAVLEQMTKNAEDLDYLSGVASAMETIEDEADIAEIRTELAEQGFVKRRVSSKNKKAAQAAKPLQFTSSDGFQIFVGKNNTQNDFLTMKMAKAHDLWFHTKDIAGSHVILVTNGKEPSEAAILEAANLAAYNSRARSSSQVPVDYATRKHVKKPSGAKPGYVIYDKHKTIYVTPASVV